MSRVDLQISRVLSRCKDKAERTIQRDEVISEMSQIQKDLCKDYFAYKVDVTLTLTATQTQYILDPTIYKIKKFVRPSTWTHQVTPVYDSGVWADIVMNTHIPITQPLYGYMWNRILNLFPAPATTGDILKALAYAYPAADLVYGGDPELDQAWDEALMLGTLKNLIGGDFERQYIEEASKTMIQGMKEDLSGPLKKQHWSDGIGF